MIESTAFVQNTNSASQPRVELIGGSSYEHSTSVECWKCGAPEGVPCSPSTLGRSAGKKHKRHAVRAWWAAKVAVADLFTVIEYVLLRRAPEAEAWAHRQGWSWLVRDEGGFEWLASQWGITQLVEFHRDGRVRPDPDGRVTVLCVLPAHKRSALTHYGREQPYAGCKKGTVAGDQLTLDPNEVNCSDCRKTVRRAKKAAKRKESALEYAMPYGVYLP